MSKPPFEIPRKVSYNTSLIKLLESIEREGDLPIVKHPREQHLNEDLPSHCSIENHSSPLPLFSTIISRITICLFSEYETSKISLE